ncbi:MAG TPA: Gfo/Idh/MocA family oxidoreductase [Roseimicrobium sp.]|nr:Gfo/Idh/MocA family oxidoreductase [Roseimicrobium sp.]
MSVPTIQRREFLSTLSIAGSACVLGATALSGQTTGAKPPRIKIGQIGTTHAHAVGKLQAFRKMTDTFEVVGVVEPDPKRRDAVAKDPTFEGIPFLTEEQLLNTPGLKAIAIETEVKDLLSHAERAIHAGFHIHLDKPAGESLSHFRRIRKEAERKKLVLQMGYMLRYNPAFQFCYQALADGWLGNVFSIEAAMSKALGSADRKALMRYTGGSMFELGCHVIDAVVRVLGRPTKITPTRLSSSSLGDGFADNQFALLEYPNATAVVRSAMVEIEGGLRRQFVICGELGTAEVRPLEPATLRLALDRPRGQFKKGYQDVPLPKPTGRYDGEFEDLARVIRGEKEFGWNAKHDIAVQETVMLASGLKID